MRVRLRNRVRFDELQCRPKKQRVAVTCAERWRWHPSRLIEFITLRGGSWIAHLPELSHSPDEAARLSF